MPWLPPLTATIPAARSASVSERSFANAPRALNEPVRCSSSSLSVTGTPRRAVSPGLGTVGVRSTCGAIRSAAARTRRRCRSGSPRTPTASPAAPAPRRHLRTPRRRAKVPSRGCAVGAGPGSGERDHLRARPGGRRRRSGRRAAAGSPARPPPACGSARPRASTCSSLQPSTRRHQLGAASATARDAAVEGLDGDAGAPGQHVVEVPGALVRWPRRRPRPAGSRRRPASGSPSVGSSATRSSTSCDRASRSGPAGARSGPRAARSARRAGAARFHSAAIALGAEQRDAARCTDGGHLARRGRATASSTASLAITR